MMVEAQGKRRDGILHEDMNEEGKRSKKKREMEMSARESISSVTQRDG